MNRRDDPARVAGVWVISGSPGTYVLVVDRIAFKPSTAWRFQQRFYAPEQLMGFKL